MALSLSINSIAFGCPAGRSSVATRPCPIISCSGKIDKKDGATANASIPVKLAWYASETFGNLASIFRPAEELDAPEMEPPLQGPLSRKIAADLIRADFEKSYFVTGNMSTGIYDENCEFADPFVSFKGLKRFKRNVSNLGSFMEQSTLKIRDWQEYEDRIHVNWRFNCVLALPWRPILAASGSTEYYFDNVSGKITRHVEIWDISPMDGLRQLVKPNPKLGKAKNVP